MARIDDVKRKNADEFFSGRRKSIMGKSGFVDTMPEKSNLKPNSSARIINDYKISGNDRTTPYYPRTASKMTASDDHWRAYENARNKGMTETQAKRAAAGVGQRSGGTKTASGGTKTASGGTKTASGGKKVRGSREGVTIRKNVESAKSSVKSNAYARAKTNNRNGGKKKTKAVKTRKKL